MCSDPEFSGQFGGVHAALDDCGAAGQVARVAVTVVVARVRQHHGQAGGLGGVQVRGRRAEIMARGGLGTEYAAAEFDHVQINFQDAFLEKGSGVGATFYKILPTLRIDVCFADTSFRINQCTVVKRRLSDHYPLVTDISWK